MITPDRRAYDPSRLLTYCALLLVFGAVASLTAIVGWQIVTIGEADNVWVAQLSAVIGWALGKAGDLYAHTFGTTAESAAKNSVIAQQARTAGAVAGTLIDTAAAVPPTAPAQNAGNLKE